MSNKPRSSFTATALTTDRITKSLFAMWPSGMFVYDATGCNFYTEPRAQEDGTPLASADTLAGAAAMAWVCALNALNHEVEIVAPEKPKPNLITYGKPS